jgi:polyhydroxybutyrate depolymerase
MTILTFPGKTIALLVLMLSSLLSIVAQPGIERLSHQNFDRRFTVYLPKGYTPDQKRPLFINMHGFTSTMSQQMTYSGFNATADLKDCIVVYPDGVQNRWNSGTNFGVSSGVDDVGFLSKLIDRMILLYNADPEMIYSTGYSAGGFMSYRLACELTNRVSAIAPVAASIVEDTYQRCTPARPISVIAFNGTADGVTNFNGFPGNFRSVPEVINLWMTKNNCDTPATTTDLPNTVGNDNSTVTKISYDQCDAGSEVVLMRINNGGHTWPGSSQIGVGNTNRDISANEEMYNFCTRFKIPEDVYCAEPLNPTLSLVPGTTNTFDLSWDAVENVSFYNVALVDTANVITILDTIGATTYRVTVPNPELARWSVRSQCISGHANFTRLQTFRISTGIGSFFKSNLNLYPNPATNRLRIDGLDEKVANGISIMDALGRVIKTDTLNNLRFADIDISMLAPGQYFIQVGNQTGVFVKM